MRYLSAYRSAGSATHCAESSGCDEMPWFCVLEELCSPHLMLPHFSCDITVAFKTLQLVIKRPDDLPRTAGFACHLDRIAASVLTDVVQPLQMILLRYPVIEPLQYFPHVSDDMDMGIDVHVEFSRINVKLQ